MFTCHSAREIFSTHTGPMQDDEPHGWLALTRKPQESIAIGDDITVSVVQIKGGSVRLAIRAPRDVIVLRSELLEVDD
jgi:carbon storage regulator